MSAGDGPLNAAADALRRFEQSGKPIELKPWRELPRATKMKWLKKVYIVLDAHAVEVIREKEEA